MQGIADACRALNTPVTGGNVSLYNETNGAAIPPTPTVGAVGLMTEYSLRADFSGMKAGDTLRPPFASPAASLRDGDTSPAAWQQASSAPWGLPDGRARIERAGQDETGDDRGRASRDRAVFAGGRAARPADPVLRGRDAEPSPSRPRHVPATSPPRV